MGLKRMISRVSMRLGYPVLPAWRLHRFAHWQHLRQTFDRFAIDTVIDAGANRGQFCTFLRRYVEYTGPILAFEPVPELYEQLVRACAHDVGIMPLRVALGDSNGDAMLNVFESDVMSSLLPVDVQRLAGLREVYRDELTLVRQQRVTVATLADILPRVLPEVHSRRLFVKTDTQGYDLCVIAGLGPLLARVCAAQVEISVTPIYAGVPGWTATLDALRERGLEVSGMYPVRRDSLGRLVTFDCVLVNGNGPSVG